MSDNAKILGEIAIETARTQLADAKFIAERRKRMAEMEDERHAAALHESVVTAASHEAHEKAQAMHSIAQEAVARAAESTIEANRAQSSAYARIAEAAERIAAAIEKASANA